ncbi:50S ribosomal protein L5 [Patescibacteria group bacterium]|nr:50S ribosomal protein L5 [Patescibacteria group bacterium]MCH7756470.1 50S ribosomal protein L5 [Patescibacteria group bacterium]
MSLTKEQERKIAGTLKDLFGYNNPMQLPKIEKVVVSVGTGRFNKDKVRNKLVEERLAKITGQKSAPRGAKKSIASFKTRQGDIIGYQVTLRGKRMYDFIDRLLHTALPRTRDFRGLKRESVDEMGNCTIGIKEHTIFPETADEDLKDIFSFAITIVTSASTKKEALAFLEHLGFPFKKVK